MALSISRTAFTTFLVNAKRQTYAAQGDDATVTPLLPGSRQLEYREGVLLYRDIYFGGASFVGQETVYDGPTPVWAMGYAGGVIPVGSSRLAALRAQWAKFTSFCERHYAA